MPERLIYEGFLPAVPSTASRLRGELTAQLVERELAAERRGDIALVLTEAAANGITHAYPRDDPGPIYTGAALGGSTLTVLVVDFGRGMGAGSEHRGGGFGLSLMRTLSDELKISANEAFPGTSVQASFDHVTTADTRPGRPSSGRAIAQAQMLREYLHVLQATHESLRAETDAVMAQASQALAHARLLQRDRSARAERA